MKTITKKECREALEYFWNCEDVDNMTTDRSFYLKILLNKVSDEALKSTIPGYYLKNCIP